MRDHWRELMADYFESRQSLAGLFLIMDIRRGITPFDEQMLAFADQVSLPTHVLLTKADKLKRGQASRSLLEVKKALEGKATVQQFSALTRQGEEEARRKLDEFMTLTDGS